MQASCLAPASPCVLSGKALWRGAGEGRGEKDKGDLNLNQAKTPWNNTILTKWKFIMAGQEDHLEPTY